MVRPTLALDLIDGKQPIVTLPAEAAIVAHAGSPDCSGLVTVRWEEPSLRMFAVDLSGRGTEITGHGEAPERPAEPLPAVTIPSTGK
jgi:hypothetical protein